MDGLSCLFAPTYAPKTYSFSLLDESTLSVTVKTSSSASTDFDRTGEVIWPVSVLLAQFLVNYAPVAYSDRLRALELGSGMGLPSCALLKRNATISCLTTDGCPDYDEPLGDNLSPFNPRGSRRQLLWGDRNDIRNCKKGGDFDFVFAADVVQWPAVVQPLALTVHALLYRSRKSAAETDRPPPTFYVGIVERDDGSLKRSLFRQLRELGFSAEREIDYSEYLPENEEGAGHRFPEHGSEFGGRECKIYETKLTDYTIMPTLLETGKDLIYTEGYENTTTLPC